jgi:pimeloyl-ACP methyl ester carboxylesterase
MAPTRTQIDRRTLSSLLTVGAATLALPAIARPRRGVPCRNIVLVHGAYADGSCWSSVIQDLQARGFRATAVQQPLTTVQAGVETTIRALAWQDGPTVLVGHSFGGTIISEAGTDPKVAALVYVAARAPDAGEDFTALAKSFPPGPAAAGLVRANSYAKLSEQAFLADFANGVARDRARVLYSTQGPVAAELFEDRTSVAAWRHKPSWYAVSRSDRTINPDLQRFLAKRMKASTVEVEAGHLSMITQSAKIADLIAVASGAAS